ncbi:MAG: hypothetical protein IKO85_00795 [Bacteroidaceae bacterium]|nr:hypothetical protein [Bacteroidaceae bacterium]
MAVVNSVESGYFVLDTPDVRWAVASEGRTVAVAITPLNGTTASYQEAYMPDGDGCVTLRGLADLLQPYTSPCPTAITQNLLTGSGVWIATLSRAQWTATLYAGDGQTVVPPVHTSYAYYSSQRTNTRPGATAIWLSRYTQRDVVPQQPLLASFMLTPGLSVQIRVRYLDAEGAMHQKLVTPTIEGVATQTPSQAAVLHYRLEALGTAAEVDADSIVQVDFELINGNTIADRLRYRIDRRAKRLLRVVAFTNCFGMLETEAFTGTETADTTMDGEYAYMDDQYEKVAQQLVTTQRVCAGSVNDERRNSIRDITTSPEVYLTYGVGGSCFDRVTVTDLELKDQRPHTTFQTAYVTLRPSHRHQEVVSRGASVNPELVDGIFDYTFDDSFN